MKVNRPARATFAAFSHNGLGLIFYHIFLGLLRAAHWLAAPFHTKARLGWEGRKGILEKIQAAIPAGEPVIWFHCASIGEFEQGRPLMEAIRQQWPRYRILLTFFSPSGYEACKKYTGADWVFYLPFDGPRTARRFLEIVHPALVVFVKYEFWFFYLKKIKYRQIPLLLVSALFRPDMSFFRWYGRLQRKMLSRFDHLFVQNESSLEMLQSLGMGSISSVSGDTRYDRVNTIATQGEDVPGIEAWAGGSRLLVAGSSWPDDEKLLASSLPLLLERDIKLVIAPHEITGKNLASLQQLFPEAVMYSSFPDRNTAAAGGRVMIIDSIGWLARLYRHAWLCYVGGGLRPLGVHNVLEAAVYNKPVVFGPFYSKYAEAVELVKEGGGRALGNMDQERGLAGLIRKFLDEEESYRISAEAAGRHVRNRLGATRRILAYIQENRLLTS
jgi:3-deoxy-D-manno-octulosonic-acid transferase